MGRHPHSGEEQVLYVLDGSAEHWVDGGFSKLTPGRIAYIPAGTAHEMGNPGPEACRFLVISAPTHGRDLLQDRAPVTTGDSEPGITDVFPDAPLRTVIDRLAEALGVTVMICDPEGMPQWRSANYPKFCRKLQANPDHARSCQINLASTGRKAAASGAFAFSCCPNLLVSISGALNLGNRFLGSVNCGHVFLTESLSWPVACTGHPLTAADAETLVPEYREIPLVMRHRLHAGAESARILIQSMVDAYYRSWEEKKRVSLEKRLLEAKCRILASQVNPHFLFNTLNSIAQQAVMEGAIHASEMMYTLAEMLRYSMKLTQQTVPLSEELRYIRHYVAIQQKRFGSKLKLYEDVSAAVMDVSVPFMTLQPLVENAIIHGLSPKGYCGIVRVNASIVGRKAILEVSDDGVGLPEGLQDQVLLQRSLPAREQHSGTGLNNLRERLQYHFGDDHALEISGGPGQGTTIRIMVPSVASPSGG